MRCSRWMMSGVMSHRRQFSFDRGLRDRRDLGIGDAEIGALMKEHLDDHAQPADLIGSRYARRCSPSLVTDRSNALVMVAPSRRPPGV